MKETLYGKIYGELLDQIQSGQYRKGEMIPSEKELTERYGVSRITAQKALGMLVERNYITRIPGRGSFVHTDEDNDMAENEACSTTTGKPKTRCVGLVTKALNDNYGPELLRSIVYACEKHDLSLVLKYSDTVEREAHCIDALIELGVEGMIVLCMQGETYSERILRLALDHFPIVLLDRGLRGISISYVGTDNVRAARELVEWLLAQGHCEIACVTHIQPEIDVILDRERGFHNALLERGYITMEDRDFVRIDLWDNDAEYEARIASIIAYMREHPEKTAYLAVENRYAELVQVACERMGRTVMPEIVGFDCIRHSIYQNRYTHIEQDEEGMGMWAVELVAQMMDGQTAPQKIFVPHRLIKRNNTVYMK